MENSNEIQQQINETFALIYDLKENVKIKQQHVREKSRQNETSKYMKKQQIQKIVKQQAGISCVSKSSQSQKSQKNSVSSVKNSIKDEKTVLKKQIQKFVDSFPIESSFKKKSSKEINADQRQVFSNVYFDDSSSVNGLNFFSKKKNDRQKQIEINQSLVSKQNKRSEVSSKVLTIDKVDFLSNNYENNSSKSQSSVNNIEISQEIRRSNESFQMLQSHYKTSQIESQKLKKSLSEKNFIEIIDVAKQVIHSPLKKTRMHNLLQAKGLNIKSSIHKNSHQKNIMQVLSQRSAKKEISDYMIEKQKVKMIKNLNERIKQLENLQDTIKTKLSKKDEEIQSISYQNYSQKRGMKFKKSENTAMGSLDYREIEESQTSLACQLKIQSQQNHINGKDSRTTNQLIMSSKPTTMRNQNFVDILQYEQLFHEFKHDLAFKKNSLKNKSLILSNDQIQIGCMSLKKDSFINFTLFITPKQFSIKNVKFYPQQSTKNLQLAIFPDILYSIKANRQQSVNIKIVVQNVQFQVQKMRVQYEIDKEQMKRRHSNIMLLSQQIILPFIFNKLCTFTSLNYNDFYEMFNSGENEKSIMSIKKFKLNQKIFNQQKIKEYFPYFAVLKKKEQLATGKIHITYGYEANYNGNVFLVIINVEDKKYASVEIKNMTGQKKAIKFMKFYLATLKFLISL